MARGAHIAPGTIYREMSYVKLIAILQCLEFEEEDRQKEDRTQKMDAMAKRAQDEFRRRP